MDNFSSTVEKYKNKNIENILDNTFELIVKKGVQNVTFNEIADNSNVGVASIYRYFQNKNNLLSNCAIYKLTSISKEIDELVNNIDFKEKKAIDEFESLLYQFVIFFENNKPFLKFLSEFDNFFTYNTIENDLNTYNDLYLKFYNISKDIYKKGLMDKSFREIDDFDTFYFTVASSLLQTCIKGAVNPKIIPLDNLISTRNKLDTHIKIAINYCKRS